MKVCPACLEKIKRRKQDACPNCGVKLAIVKSEDGVSRYELEDADSTLARESEGARPLEVGLLISTPGDIPEVRIAGENKFQVTYRGVIPHDWIYCPSCEKALFQNIVMQSYYLEQEIKCLRCKAITGFIFDAGQVLLPAY